jgi:gliding motility-associated protein GldM
MAGGKLPPRQKMIGMMYLVLTALLAMNVSKEIINAFVVMNTGLQNTNNNTKNKNSIIYTAFEASLQNDEKKTRPFYQAAQTVKKNSEELVKYIDHLKAEILMHAQSMPEAVADTFPLRKIDKLDDYDTPTHFMVGSDPANVTGEAKELKKKMEDFKIVLLSLLNAKDKAYIQGSLDKGLYTGKSYNQSEEKDVSWEWYNFYHLPLAAAIANLTKIQNDVRNSEGDVVNLLYKNVSAADFKFDTISAKIIAASNYVIQGEEYQADVFVAASSKTQNPVIILAKEGATVDSVTGVIKGPADSTSVKVVNGIGKYVTKEGKMGVNDWSGVIKVKAPDGSFKRYPFKAQYRLAPPSVSVSPDKMNVFYLGVDNPVTVGAAGFANEDLVVSGNGVQMVKSGKGYIARPTPGAREATVTVSAHTKDGTKSLGPGVKFRVKQIPTPIGMVAGKTGDDIMSKGEIGLIGAVSAKLEGFDFDLPFPVVSFDLTTVNNTGLLLTKSTVGNVLSADMKKLLASAKPSQRFAFENMKVRMPDGTTRKVPGVTLKTK